MRARGWGVLPIAHLPPLCGRNLLFYLLGLHLSLPPPRSLVDTPAESNRRSLWRGSHLCARETGLGVADMCSPGPAGRVLMQQQDRARRIGTRAGMLNSGQTGAARDVVVSRSTGVRGATVISGGVAGGIFSPRPLLSPPPSPSPQPSPSLSPRFPPEHALPLSPWHRPSPVPGPL